MGSVTFVGGMLNSKLGFHLQGETVHWNHAINQYGKKRVRKDSIETMRAEKLPRVTMYIHIKGAMIHCQLGVLD